MYGVILAASFVVPIGDDVALTDATWFGCSQEMAAANLQACHLWRNSHVRPLQTKNGAAWAALDFRADRVTAMWSDLTVALNEKEPEYGRLLALRRLRWHLGDEAYFGGKIHSPIPPGSDMRTLLIAFLLASAAFAQTRKPPQRDISGDGVPRPARSESLATPDKPAKPRPANDTLDEINAWRATKGLPPFIRDEMFTESAQRCADYRAAHLLEGHTYMDHQFLSDKSGITKIASGCAKRSPGERFNSCGIEKTVYTRCGAAVAIGRDGQVYMQVFLR